MVFPHKLRNVAVKKWCTFLLLPAFDHHLRASVKVLTCCSKPVLHVLLKSYHKIHSRWKIKAPCGAVVCLSFSHDSSWNIFDLVCGDEGEQSCLVPGGGGGGGGRRMGVEAPQWIFKISRHPARPLRGRGLRLSWVLLVEAVKVIRATLLRLTDRRRRTGATPRTRPSSICSICTKYFFKSLKVLVLCLLSAGIHIEHLPALFLCVLPFCNFWMTSSKEGQFM